MQPILCAGCGQPTPGYDIVHCGSIERGYRSLCSRCFNAEVARASGREAFEHTPFEPVTLADGAGTPPTFHFCTRLFGTGVVLEAFELREEQPAGYQFRVAGDPEEDRFVLLGRLMAKMRRTLALQHLKDDELGMQIADRDTVRGLIQWDEACAGRVPLLVIDGREITWEALGRMVMAFEGWQFKLELRDLTEEW
jgi:hypothetical protein